MLSDRRVDVAHLKPVERVAANVQVYEQLRQALMSGQYAPGDVLSTRHIAEALNVSQTPIREAFHRLVAERALENRPNRTIGLPILAVGEFNDLTEIRIHLEGLAAEKAATLRSEAQCERLHALVHEMERAPAPTPSTPYLELNRQFHFLVYEASQSPSLVQLIDQLWLRVGPLLKWSSSQRDNITRSGEWHRHAVQAIVNGDAEGARRAIVRDISEAAEIVRVNLSALPEGRAPTSRRSARHHGLNTSKSSRTWKTD